MFQALSNVTARMFGTSGTSSHCASIGSKETRDDGRRTVKFDTRDSSLAFSRTSAECPCGTCPPPEGVSFGPQSTCKSCVTELSQAWNNLEGAKSRYEKLGPMPEEFLDSLLWYDQVTLVEKEMSDRSDTVYASAGHAMDHHPEVQAESQKSAQG